MTESEEQAPATSEQLALAPNEEHSASTVDDTEEVEFDETGDLGISVRVDADGAVVVSKLLQLRGYGELSCPTLHAGDVLVAIDKCPVVDLSFADVMLKLRATADTRPTRLEFVGVDRFESADRAVAKWQQCQGSAAQATRLDDPRFREGEFEVTFECLQPTGLRFSESYMMTHPLKLAHVESALLSAVGYQLPDKREMSRRALLNTILVRIDEDSVLGAPLDDVMALLYEPDSFPKTLWLAAADNLQEDFQVVTLGAREQLKWLCFVPVEMMMEVAVVSYAALATNVQIGNTSDTAAERETTRRRMRSDGISESHYLMAINGFPVLRVSSSTYFSDSSCNDEGIVSVVNKSLDALLIHKRTLRFRDLKAYRREFLAHAPLSPWRRRRTRTSTADSTRNGPLSAASSPATSGDEGSMRFDLMRDGLVSPGPTGHYGGVWIEHQPRSFFEILLDMAQSEEAVRTESEQFQASEPGVHAPGGSQRPVIKRYHGLANCEGVRSFTPVLADHVKCVVVPDNRRPVGIQLETDVLPSGRPIFKRFLRSDGPALRSQRVHLGDRILAVNGVAIVEIPTDMLIRILHGEDNCSSGGAAPTTSLDFAARKRGLSDAPRRRVLRLNRHDGSASLLPAQGFFDQAKKLIALSKARLALWKSSQSRPSITA